jgi:hypothetical protein
LVLHITGKIKAKRFASRMLRKIFRHKGEKVTEKNRENCIIRSFMLCAVYQILAFT